jgi:Enoyl-CoA hydratase/isomerase
VDTHVAAPALAVARARLAELPCPTVAVLGTHGDAAAPSRPLADRFDVVVAGEDDLAPVRAAVAHTPLAAMALVQLLRHNEGLDVHEGLIAESLVYATLQGGPELARWLAGRARPPRPVPASGPAVLATRSDDRLALELNRPERHNAFSAEMRDALAEALQLAVADPSVTAIAVSGRGPSFCSGGDLDEFGTRPDPATAHAIRSTRNVGRLLAACADRVRMELHGACIGAGIELAAFAACVTASPDAFFELPEVAMGLVPGAGGTVSIPRRIGRQRTAWLALSGARLDAATAARWGLVDAVVT